MAPIIVTGMHRSGTTLLATLLERLGIFMGASKDHNSEATFFQNLNVWLLESAGARWDVPDPFKWAVADDALRQRYVDYLRIMLGSPRAASYLGPVRYLRGPHLDRLKFHWGWKDPRNTYTLPVWIEVFGQRARLLHVRRHGVDVARSLVARHSQIRAQRLAHFDRVKRLPLLYWIRPKRGEFLDSSRCSTMEGAFSLWVEYAEQAERLKVSAVNPLLEVVYENLLADPAGELRRIADFCQVTTPESTFRSICEGLQLERAFAYRQSPQDVAFARAHAETLTKFGYG